MKTTNILDLPRDVLRLIAGHYVHWTSGTAFLSSCRYIRNVFSTEERWNVYKRNIVRRTYFDWCLKRYQNLIHYTPVEDAPFLTNTLDTDLKKWGLDIPEDEQAAFLESVKRHERGKISAALKAERSKLMFTDIMDRDIYQKASDKWIPPKGTEFLPSDFAELPFVELCQFPLSERLRRNLAYYPTEQEIVERVHAHACLELLDIFRDFDMAASLEQQQWPGDWPLHQGFLPANVVQSLIPLKLLFEKCRLV